MNNWFWRMIEGANRITSLVLKIVVIGSVVLTIAWVGFSFIVGNSGKDYQQGLTPIPPFPSKNVAGKIVILKNTGETLLTNNITGKSPIYTLNGYYELTDHNRKWIYHRATLTINEKYMPVSIVAR